MAHCMTQKAAQIIEKLKSSPKATNDDKEYAQKLALEMSEFIQKHLLQAVKEQELNWLFKLLNESLGILKKLIPVDDALIMAIKNTNLELFTLYLHKLSDEAKKDFIQSFTQPNVLTALIKEADLRDQEKDLVYFNFVVPAFKELVSRCPQGFNPTDNTETLIHKLVDLNATELIEILINHGADVNTLNASKEAPLVYTITAALKNPNSPTFNLIIQHSNARNIKNVANKAIANTENTSAGQDICCKILQKMSQHIQLDKEVLMNKALQYKLNIVVNWLCDN